MNPEEHIPVVEVEAEVAAVVHENAAEPENALRRSSWNGEHRDQHVEELQSSVHLSVRLEDKTTVAAIIDITASRTKIINDLRRELSRFAVPYRNLDKRILEAIRVRSVENLNYEEASIRVFGDPSFARKIRYWQNRWQLQ